MQQFKQRDLRRHIWWALCGILLVSGLWLNPSVQAARKKHVTLNFTQLQTQVAQQKHQKGQWWTQLSDQDGTIVLTFNPKVVKQADRDVIMRRCKAMTTTIELAAKRSLLVIDHIEIQDAHQNVIAEKDRGHMQFYLL